MKPRVHDDQLSAAIPRVAKAEEDPANPSWPAPAASRFYRNHLLLPVAAAFGFSVMLILLHGDFWLADWFYALQGHAWTLKSHPLTESLVHVGGRTASIVAWLLVFAAYLWSCFDVRLASWRRPLAYLALTTLLATAVVAGAKSVSGMDCPWDLQRYGGDRAFVSLFAHRPATMPAAACFPAGHASGGYAWVTLYFFFLATRPRLRWVGLSLAVAVGATFGFAQQLRGAHFLSHDLWTLVICWLVALIGYISFFNHSSLRASTGSTVTCPASATSGQ